MRIHIDTEADAEELQKVLVAVNLLLRAVLDELAAKREPDAWRRFLDEHPELDG
jgi:hypothetical protein